LLGATTLIDAIAHAKTTACEVDRFLMGSERMKELVRIEDAQRIGRTPEMDDIPQQAMPTLPLPERNLSGEVEQGLDAVAAIEETNRCYRCHYKFEIDQDKCIKCDWCLKARPRPECILMLKEIQHDDEGRTVAWKEADSMRQMNLIWINQDECIRCGACLKACPVDAITLQKVSLSTESVISNTVADLEDR
jgi:ferredoxin